MIRENVYKGNQHDGVELYKFNDERSFVIEPLASVTGVTPVASNNSQPAEVKRQVVKIPSIVTNSNLIDANIKST